MKKLLFILLFLLPSCYKTVINTPDNLEPGYFWDKWEVKDTLYDISCSVTYNAAEYIYIRRRYVAVDRYTHKIDTTVSLHITQKLEPQEFKNILATSNPETYVFLLSSGVPCTKDMYTKMKAKYIK